MNKTQMLNRFAADGEQRLELAYALDQMEMTRSRNLPGHTKFLSPATRAALQDLLAAAGNPRHLFYGGFEGAERTMCVFIPVLLFLMM